ncbi:MAG: ROK family protein [Candidatus Omnitrophota bacterium]
MAKKEIKSIAQFFRICPGSEGEQMALDVFELIKQKKSFSPSDIEGKRGVSKKAAADYINACVKKDLLKISEAGKKSLLKFNDVEKKVLGIGFGDDECILIAMDLAGNITARDFIKIDLYRKWKGKNKEVEALVEQIRQGTKLQGERFSCAGIAFPEEMISINPKSTEILAKGMKSLWGCDVYSTKEATAAAYGEKDSMKEPVEGTMVYLHTDIGIGAVVKGEMVFEADEYSTKEGGAYLKPWNQFSVMNTAKNLIDKGVGTDIVKMANGDIDRINLDIILRAAENKDELAEDLVKRSGLALGVRAAYLVNLFDSNTVVLGGGTERKEGSFIQYVQESAGKFVVKNLVNRLKIVPGVLGKEASSTGAALLCRRELFITEV